MTVLAVAVCLLIWAANVAVYRRNKRKYNRSTQVRTPYTLSTPTRVFRHVGPALYLAVLAHILVQPLILDAGAVSRTRLALGALLGFGGVALLAWSLHSLGRNYAPCYTGELPTERVRSGPYRFISHPIYASNILQFCAVIVMLPGVIAYGALGMLLWVYSFAIRDENRSLDQAFSSTAQAQVRDSTPVLVEVTHPSQGSPTEGPEEVQRVVGRFLDGN